MNAQFHVTFSIHLPSITGGSGDTFQKSIYLSSYSHSNPIVAHDRANETARKRLDKWLTKTYGYRLSEFVINLVDSSCVG